MVAGQKRIQPFLAGELPFDVRDQRAVVMQPGMEAGAVEAEIRQENLAHAFPASPTGTSATRSQVRRCVDPVLAKEIRHVAAVRAPELKADQQHHLAADGPAPQAGKIFRGSEISVVSDSLVFDLLDRVPLPQLSRRLAVRPAADADLPAMREP